MNLQERATKTFLHGKQKTTGCIFCNTLSDRILFETEHFRVLIDTYPIVPGHLLISTKQHYATIGELPDSLRQEFSEVKDEVKSIAKKIQPNVLFYEHGKAGSCHTTSGHELVCEHFHHHCLPVSGCIHSEISKYFHSMAVKNVREYSNLAEQSGSYLYFENSLGVARIYPAESHQVPPHFLRTLLCNHLNLKELIQWERYQTVERYIASVELLRNALEQGRSYALS